jgi:hypothetical protein
MNLDDCTCGRIRLGSEITEHRNWNPDCSEHGVYSEWYNSTEQQAKRQEDNAQLRELQAKAREMRERSRAEREP